jgi:GrpB-like predicted nucleotidyltransferase (UPF0157 family)
VGSPGLGLKLCITGSALHSADRLLLSPGSVDGRAAHAYRQCPSGAKRACLGRLVHAAFATASIEEDLPSAHLHLIQAGHPRWAEQLAFRDALRRDGQLARQYEDLKRLLAVRHAGDREAYTAAKAAFVANALAGHAG